VEAALWRSALEDPNEFLRAKAMEKLLEAPPAETVPLLPDEVPLELQRVLREDPDLNRRFAALLQLRYHTITALEDLWQVAAWTGNPRTRRALLIAAAETLSPEELHKMASSSKEKERAFGQEAEAYRRKHLAGQAY
jgi:hypothetical protein